MRKGIAIEMVAYMVLAILALVVLLVVLTNLTPGLSKVATNFIDNIKNSICDKLGVLCKLVIR